MSSSRPRSGRRLAGALVVLAVVGAAVWMALTVGNPFPPHTVIMATGPEGSADHEFGARYREVLRRSGFDLRVIRTQGGVENLARLRDPRSGVKVAFLESGLTSPEQSPDLVSLGTVSLEPLWLVLPRSGAGRARPDQAPAPCPKLKGKRISIEPEGSATRVLARRLLALNGVADTSVVLLGLPTGAKRRGAAAGRDRRGRDADLLAVARGAEAPGRRRHRAPGAIPAPTRTSRCSPACTRSCSPAGVADLARNIPPQDVTLLAVEASLVVRKDLHPALQYLLLQAAAEIHGGPEIFQQGRPLPGRRGRQPAAQRAGHASSTSRACRSSIECSRSGWPGLTERVLILLIPLLVVVFPPLRFLPGLYRYMVEHRIYSLYGQLRMLEGELERAGPVRPRTTWPRRWKTWRGGRTTCRSRWATRSSCSF